MKNVMFLLFLLYPMVNLQSQERSYYGWINEGEDMKRAFCLRFNNDGQMVDTLYVIDNLYQPVSVDGPVTIENWKAWFGKIEPFKAEIEHLEAVGDTLRFSTAKCFHDGNLWFSFSFTGRLVHNQIKGKLTQIEYTGFKKEVYTDNFQLKFSQ